jgi:hypothetical protein
MLRLHACKHLNSSARFKEWKFRGQCGKYYYQCLNTGNEKANVDIKIAMLTMKITAA